MKHFKRVLPLVLALVLLCSTVLAPCAQAASMANTTSGAIWLEGMQPFNGTDALILSAIAELQEQGKTLQIAKPDAALVQRVEKAAGESYEAVKTGLFTDLKADLMKGSVDVSALGLNRSDMAAVMAEVLRENYLYNAVTELSYTVKGGKVQGVGFRVSEGFASAMNALNAEFDEELNFTVPTDKLASLVVFAESGLHVGGAASTQEGEEGEGGEEEGTESTCRNHTVGSTVMLADLNEDGTLNVKDIALFRQMNVEGDYSEVADANGDGVLNVKDIAVIRQMNVSGEYQYLPGGNVQFHWEQVVNMQPDPQLSQNEKGEYLDSNGQVVVGEDGNPVQTPYVFDAEGNPTGLNPQIAVLNGGLIYNPETGEILQGLLPEVDWNLVGISLHCTACGQDVEITDPEILAQNQMRQEAYIHFLSADQSQYEIVTFGDNEKPPLAPVMQTDENGNPVIGEDGKPVYVQEVDENGNPVVDADGNPVYVMAEDPSYLHYSEMQIGTYFDDTAVFIDTDGDEIPDTPMPEFAVDEEGNPIVDENGNPVPAVDEQGNVIIPGMYTDAQDNGAIEVAWYYGQLSAFNADNAEYFGVSSDYWTSKNSEQNPMAAIKSLCNIDPNMDLPPMQMLQLVQMLPQAFMAYVHFYGNELLAMRDAAMAEVDKLPRSATDVQVMLALHDWLAENAVFDMGSMVSVNASGGSPETDPIQMTTFGALLSNQLTTMTNSGYYGCICLGYAAAYNYLVQCAFPSVYQDNSGNWLTPAEVGDDDIVDFGQVMFYANTSETSIAGEGFGGGMFNNVHYYNMVRLPNAPTTVNQGIVLDADEEDEMVGNWFFVDACYDDIYIECLSQYRAEADGSVYHSYFLVSPQTMIKLWADSIDYIDNLYDGYTYQVKTDADGNPVYYPEDDSRYNPDDPQHPQYEKVENPNEEYNHNTCYEDSWFAGATSKIYYDNNNWYYVDSGTSSTAYSDMMDDNGDMSFDQSDMPEGWDQDSMMHSSRVDVEQQDKIKTRPLSAPDWWPEEEDEEEDDSSSGGMGMDFNMDLNTKEDTYATVLFDYGTGLFAGVEGIDLSAAVEEDFIYNDQFPGLTHCLGLYDGVLYFNLGNQIYGFNTADNTCSLIKEYNTVSATSDGRPFTASSYTLAADGTDLTVENNPIAGLVVRTAYTPLYDYVDAEGKVVMDYMGNLQNGYTYETMQSAIVGQVFQMMAAQDTMTVNIGTNYTFTSAFADGMTDDEKAASRYTVEAINLNPDYNLGMSSGDEENNNEEFLWCANIREDISMADLVATEPGEDKVPCTAHNDGHAYVYNAEENVYICENCKLSANNIVKAEEGIVVTMEALAESGMTSDSFAGMEGMEGVADPAVSVSPGREAAVKKTGEILITVEVEEGIEKRVRGISYIAAGAAEGTEPTEVTTTNEAGQFVLNKAAAGCIEISVLLDDTYTITAPEHIVIEGEKTDAIEGEEIKFTVEEGYRAEDVTITYEVAVEPTEPAPTEPEVTEPETTDPAAPAADETEPSEPEATEPEVEYETKTVVLTADENGVYTFTMPASDVTITAAIERVYDITTSSNLIIVEDDLEEAAEGETVSFTVDEGYQATNVKVTYQVAVEPTEPEPTEPEVTEPAPSEPDPSEPAPEPAPAAEVTYETVEAELTFDDKTGTYTFTMPAADVTISAQFEKLYNITISDTVVNGTVTSKAKAVEGETVTLTITPAAGYEFGTVTVTSAQDGTSIGVNKVSDGIYKFAMPAGDVTVSATFKALPTYEIEMQTQLVGGEASVDKNATFEGDTVTVTAAPVPGYKVKSVTVTAESGADVDVAVDSEDANKYTFVMPAEKVTVTVELEAIEYTITVAEGELKSLITVQETAHMGQDVAITVADTDKTLKIVVSYTLEGAETPTEVVVTINESGAGTFEMPAANVTITVTEVTATE